MKYVKESQYVPGAKDFYSIVNYMIDKVRKVVHISLMFVSHTADGLIDISYSEHSILDKQEYIIDPEWTEQSIPPKPTGFNAVDPSTWGNLSFDDIPKVLNPTKLFASNIIKAIERGTTSAESVLIDALIEEGILPNDPNTWSKI